MACLCRGWSFATLGDRRLPAPVKKSGLGSSSVWVLRRREVKAFASASGPWQRGRDGTSSGDFIDVEVDETTSSDASKPSKAVSDPTSAQKQQRVADDAAELAALKADTQRLQARVWQRLRSLFDPGARREPVVESGQNTDSSASRRTKLDGGNGGSSSTVVAPVAALPWLASSLVAASWLVFLAQWLPSLPSLLADPDPVNKVVQGLLGFICVRTPLTRQLSLDVEAVALGFASPLAAVTSALLQPGLAVLLLAMEMTWEAAARLEAELGTADTAVIAGMCTAGTAAGQALGALGAEDWPPAYGFMGGPGLAVGLLAALLIKALFRADLPLPSTRALVSCVLLMALSSLMPWVGVHGVLGGLAGGLAAGLLSAPVLYLLRIAVLLPCALLATALGLLSRLPQLALGAAVVLWRVASSTVAAVIGAVRRY